ncbi:protein gone early-like [Centruroides sculpturatus]|uniref:protein gone early-like n=1 Tax=Centruroides sculpturatus TaxID=218467 RepID=UPI000C6CF0D5|nr:protein gone early-like [Centruroides sculpturatus]
MPDPERILNEDYEYKIFTINELKAISPVIDWWDLLQTYYPHADISMGTEVGVFFKDYFHSLSQLLSTTDNIALNNYMMWRFVSSYIPHLSKKERKIANKFYQTLNGK